MISVALTEDALLLFIFRLHVYLLTNIFAGQIKNPRILLL